MDECVRAANSLSLTYATSNSLHSLAMPFGCYYKPAATPRRPHRAGTLEACLYFNAWFAFGPPTNDSHAICRQTATPQPTPAPTPQPTLAPSAPLGVSASATGDPHLRNIYGERFDLMRPGKHVLIHIPRRAPTANTMLHVEGDVRHLGGACEFYFQELNITGTWASVRRSGGGLSFRAGGPRGRRESKWLEFGKVGIKIVRGRTTKGTRYLNFYVRHLAATGLAVGGLLGEDDHTEQAARSGECGHRATLAL